MNTPDTEWRRSEHMALNIVHQIGDLLYETLPADVAHEYFVDARQATNDRAIDFVERLIDEAISSRDTYWKTEIEKAVLKGERNRIIEQIREERDTYWKERVRGMKWETNHVPFATEEQIRKCTCSACKHNQALDTLLDNLK